MEHRIALSHAGGIAVEAILEKLSACAIEAEALVLLDNESRVGTRLAYSGGHLKVQDQHAFDLAGCSLLLMPEADAELEAAALRQGCLLVSHAIENETAALFLGGAETDPEIAWSETSLRLVGAELSCLLPVLLELDRMRPIDQLNVTLLRSAEFHGKAGIDELATQTIGLLNAREAVAGVYPQQIAFNLLPRERDDRITADLDRFLGNISCSSTLQMLDVPIFHGFAAALQIRFVSEVELEECIARLQAMPEVIVKKGLASPISDCNQSFSCVISHLEQAPEQPASIQFWMITDPMRYGLANNYVNVTEFLLKSFL
jgi:aspartate-semialdehyde dehydrogenase